MKIIPLQLSQRFSVTPILKHFTIDEGWNDLALELDAELSKIVPEYTLTSVERVNGELHFYGSFSKNPDKVYQCIALIEEYAIKSKSICEICGSKENTKTIAFGPEQVTRCELHNRYLNYNSLI